VERVLLEWHYRSLIRIETSLFVTTLLPSSDNSKKIIRRVRRFFIGLYLLFTFGAILLTFFSIVAVHYRWRSTSRNNGPRIHATADDLAELRSCFSDLSNLFNDLHRKTLAIVGQDLRAETNPATEWLDWSNTWRLEWRSVEWRCRLNELAGKGISQEIDQMATIHLTLDQLQLSYGEMIDNFIEKHVERLRKLRQDLNHVQQMIERRRLPSQHAQVDHSGVLR
jgi:hypothetical protein